MNIKKEILLTTSDLVRNLLYYDRKEDEDLSVDAIWDAIDSNKITKEEIVQEFSKVLHGTKMIDNVIYWKEDAKP